MPRISQINTDFLVIKILPWFEGRILNFITHDSQITMNYTADIRKLPRHFVPKNFTLTDWQSLEPYFKNLLDRNIDTKENLEQWLKDQSELEALINEDACWRQIKMTCDTEIGRAHV